MGLEDLWLILSQGVHLRLLAVAPAFGAARDLPKIFGSGFSFSQRLVRRLVLVLESFRAECWRTGKS
jgi:hypothetical protein